MDTLYINIILGHHLANLLMMTSFLNNSFRKIQLRDLQDIQGEYHIFPAKFL